MTVLNQSTTLPVPAVTRPDYDGPERLRILSRVMRPSSRALLERIGVKRGMNCLELGCGTGELAFDLAEMVGPAGRVVGADTNPALLMEARGKAIQRKLTNIEFRIFDIQQDEPAPEFDLIHARFLLTHSPHPEKALARMMEGLLPGGVTIIEDIDFRGYISDPECPALWRYVDLYTRTVQRHGGDANIGPRVPALLKAAKFERVEMNVVQPAGTEGDVKLITPFTMENIADAVVAEGLATRAEVDKIIDELYAFAAAPNTLGCMPRIVETWGYRDALARRGRTHRVHPPAAVAPPVLKPTIVR